MKKKIIRGIQARAALKKGVDELAQTVVTTLGPKGRNVAIDKSWGAPTVVHDGVTVAKEVFMEDPFENMGSEMVKEAASKTNDAAGDGTTTATLLAQSIINAGFEELNKENSPINPMIVKEGIELAARAVIKEIKAMSKPVVGKDIEKVATVSAQNKEIGKLVAEAIEKVGENGVVTPEEGKGVEMSVDYREGMEFDKGYMSAYFVTNPEKMEAEIENPLILITDKQISSIDDLTPFLQSAIKETKDIVIIADEVIGDALSLLVVNKLRGNFNVLAIKAPGFGDRKADMLKDIAILTGGTVVSESAGVNITNADTSVCGRADKIWCNKEIARIIGGKGNKLEIETRVEQIKGQIATCESDFDKEKYQERLAKLSTGVAVINVGANSEMEMKEKKERVIDAIAATKAALEEGIVPGGGVTLLRARKVIKELMKKLTNEDEKFGAKLLYDALETPLRWIVKNAGGDPTKVICEVEKETGDYGFNVLTMKYGSMIEAGIIDPAKVTRSVVENSVSVAMMILTTEALITEIEEKDEK
jgi:chaperonin GroEL